MTLTITLSIVAILLFLLAVFFYMTALERNQKIGHLENKTDRLQNDLSQQGVKLRRYERISNFPEAIEEELNRLVAENQSLKEQVEFYKTQAT